MQTSQKVNWQQAPFCANRTRIWYLGMPTLLRTVTILSALMILCWLFLFNFDCGFILVSLKLPGLCTIKTRLKRFKLKAHKSVSQQPVLDCFLAPVQPPPLCAASYLCTHNPAFKNRMKGNGKTVDSCPFCRKTASLHPLHVD